MIETCGCCEGIQKLTPMAIANRPGLNALVYRVGTHASFLETMKARLSNYYLDIPLDEFDDQGRPKTVRVYPLQGLTSRTASDPPIALLDAWATVGDVLTFYQQRVANEGYLRTATERRSILELARLVGYKLRPGVSASTYLAYTLEASKTATIPQGSRAQSLPGPGELPQTFETSQDLSARSAWNNLAPRLNKPQVITKTNIPSPLYLKGIATNLKPGDPILIVLDDSQIFARVASITPDAVASRTAVTLQTPPTVVQARASTAMATVKTPARKTRLMPLSDYVTSFSSAAALDPSHLIDLITAFSNDLLETFKALAEAPASRDRDRAVADTRSDLKQLRDLLKLPLPNISGIDPSRYLEAVIAWIERALALLEAVTITPPPPLRLRSIDKVITYLAMPAPPATLAPRSARYLPQNLEKRFVTGSDAVLQVVTKMQPALESVFYAAYRNLAYAPAAKERSAGVGGAFAMGAGTSSTPTVYALRVTAPLFGGNAPRLPAYGTNGQPDPDWNNWYRYKIATDETTKTNVVFLDNAYDKVQAGDTSYAVIQNQTGSALFSEARGIKVCKITNTVQESRAAYGISGKTTQLTLSDSWRTDPASTDKQDGTNTWEAILRGTVVYVQSEELPLALEPIGDPIPEPSTSQPPTYKTIELADLYDGLNVGQWLIVSGERTDITDANGTIIPGVPGTELVMLDSIQQIDPAGPDDNTHSLLTFANDLRYTYKRSTVVVYGNVVPATHGETRNEVLGSGDGSKPLQRFALRQSPLTYLAAPTAAGAESTLKVYVNDVQWHESDSLAGLQATDRRFITRTDDDDKTSVIFGNGQQGARLPTGVENVKAVYRTGIGKPGNVKAEQISLLVTRPLGVKSVINPLAATGGADRESRDQARRNAPLAVMALDRLVSVQDYADFTRTFAGIGKAAAAHLTNGQRQLAHVTIAGADDIPIDENSDLYNNLLEALRILGDPYQPIEVDPRELKLLIIMANVRVNADYIWEKVEPQIRAVLLDTFSFERRELGQSAFLSEAIAAMQAVPGVVYVDVDTFGAIPEKTSDQGQRRLLTPDEIATEIQTLVTDSNTTGRPTPYVEVKLADFEQGALRPAELAYLSPELPATLILNRI